MKEVLALIEKKKEEFANLALFEFLADKSIDPRQRLAFAPCMAPFAMMFKDINAYALRQEPTDNPIQKMINQHSYEDGRHWRWYLEDMEKLGFNKSMEFVDTLKFLWGKETQKTREVSYNLFALCVFQTDPILKLAVVESIEATGTVALDVIAKLGDELQQLTGQRCRYYSASHYAVETGHIQADVDDVEQFLENIELTEEQKEKAFQAVETVFSSFSAALDEFLVYAKNHTYQQPFTKHNSVTTTQYLDEMPTQVPREVQLLS